MVLRVPFRLQENMQRIAESIRFYRKQPDMIARILFLSFVFQIMAYTIFYLYSRAIRLDVPYYYCLAFVPVVYLLEALPISIGGFGLREGGLVYFLGKIGVDASEALSLSVIVLSMHYLLILVGGFYSSSDGVFFLRRLRSRSRLRKGEQHKDYHCRYSKWLSW